MKNTYRLNTFLAMITFLVSLANLAFHTFAPAAIFPNLDVILISSISLGALLLEYYLGGGVKHRSWIGTTCFAVITFSLLPFAGGWIHSNQILRYGVIGGIIFLTLTFLFTSICERLTSGSAGKVAPLFSAGILFLAVQGCSSLLL